MMNWLRKLVGLGATAKNLTSLGEEECKEEIQAFVKKSNLNLFQGNVQNLYSTQRIKETSVCPRCESETEKKAAIFVCATNTLPQIIISTANHFCTNCSSALVDDKILQKSCEKGKVYRGIIGFYIRENIQTYQSLNEYTIRYHYDQNSKPSGIKITGDKIVAYDPKIHGSKGTKSQHKIPSAPVTLMDRVERRDKIESLTDSKFSDRKGRSNQNDDSEEMTQEQKDKAARSERARIAMENVGKKGRNKNTKPKKKEDFADSVNETKQDFKDKVEQKSNFNPKKRQKPVVENPNEKQDAKQEKQKEQLDAKQEETKSLPTNKKQDPPARASQRKKQTSNSDTKEENVANQQTDKIDKTDKTDKIENKQNVVETNQVSKVETSANTSIEATEENAAPKKNRRYKQRRSTRKTRSNKRPVRNTVETEQITPQNEVKNEQKTEHKVEQKTQQKSEQNKKQEPKPKRENIHKQKEVAQEAQDKAQNSNQAQNKVNNKETDKADTNKESKQHQSKETNNEQLKKESVIEKLHQNLQESSKASVAPKEEKQKEQQKESSRLARLKDDTQEEKVSRRRPRSNVRPPIELDLKNVNPRRRYNNTKKK